MRRWRSYRRSRRNRRRYGPKKPKSAFLYFSCDRRSSLKEEQPDLKITDVSRLLGDEWNHLTEEEKQPYLQQAAKDRDRYNEERQRNY